MGPIYIDITCYMRTVATSIVVTDAKIYFTEVHNVFAFQKLLTCMSALIRLVLKRKEY